LATTTIGKARELLAELREVAFELGKAHGQIASIVWPGITDISRGLDMLAEVENHNAKQFTARTRELTEAADAV